MREPWARSRVASRDPGEPGHLTRPVRQSRLDCPVLDPGRGAGLPGDESRRRRVNVERRQIHVGVRLRPLPLARRVTLRRVQCRPGVPGSANEARPRRRGAGGRRGLAVTRAQPPCLREAIGPAGDHARQHHGRPTVRPPSPGGQPSAALSRTGSSGPSSAQAPDPLPKGPCGTSRECSPAHLPRGGGGLGSRAAFRIRGRCGGLDRPRRGPWAPMVGSAGGASRRCCLLRQLRAPGAELRGEGGER